MSKDLFRKWIYPVLIILLIPLIFIAAVTNFGRIKLTESPEITGKNGETISNVTNGYWKLNGPLLGTTASGMWATGPWSIDPSLFAEYTEEFIRFDTTAINTYVKPKTSGARVTTWIRAVDISGGAIVLMVDTSTSDTSLINIQLQGESFKVSRTKDKYSEVRLKLYDSTLVSALVGFTNLKADSLRNAKKDSGSMSCGVYFQKSIGTNIWKFVTVRGGKAAKAVTLFDSNGDSTVIARTRDWVRLGFKIIDSVATPYVNGYANSTVIIAIPYDSCMTFTAELGGSSNQLSDTLALEYVKDITEK